MEALLGWAIGRAHGCGRRSWGQQERRLVTVVEAGSCQAWAARTLDYIQTAMGTSGRSDMLKLALWKMATMQNRIQGKQQWGKKEGEALA